MTPIDQTIISLGNGNCTEAMFASLFDIKLEDIKIFRHRNLNLWLEDIDLFLISKGFKIFGFNYKNEGKPDLKYSIDGKWFPASVNSKTYPGKCTHAVIVDVNRKVIHDPNPNKLWQGLSIKKDSYSKIWLIEKL
jgi:hypothetical protein